MKRKIKIMKEPPPISDEEIRKYMDFDGLLKKNAGMNKTNSLTGKYLLSMFAASVVIGSLAWLFVDANRYDMPTAVVPRNESETKPLEEDSAPVVKTMPPLNDEPEVQSDDIAQQPDTAPSRETPRVKSAPSKEVQRDTEQKKTTDIPEKESAVGVDSPAEKDSLHTGTAEPPLTNVDVQAEPVKGFPDLYAYFARELTYPEVADSVDGVVVVAFTINTEGRPEKISIEETIGLAFSQEAIRLIENMPQWKPATFNGRPMATRLSLPITFQVQRINMDQR